MPTELSDVIDSMSTTTMAFLETTITDYWPLILGLIVLLGIGWKIRKVVGLAR